MRLIPLLLTSLVMVSSASIAAPKTVLSQSDQLKEGITAFRSGDKTKAWEIMFPLAQAGDVQSMYYLGEMMMRSPEYADSLERAAKFFAVASAKGHAGAAKQLEVVQRMIAQKSSDALPTIAGANGTPSKQEVARVNAELARHNAEVIRFTDNPVEAANLARVEVKVFITPDDSSTERMYKLTQELSRQFGAQIKAQVFVVINPANWTADAPPLGGMSIPPNGLTPDFKGQIAAQYGVRTFPRVVVVPANGQAQQVNDLNSIPTLISSLL